MVAILVTWPRPFEKLSFPHPMEAPYEIWLWLAKQFLRRRCLKSVDDDGRPRGWRMDNRACLYYKLTYEPKGSGELIKSRENRPKINHLALFTCLEFSFTEICIILLMNFLSFIWVSRRAKAKLFKCPWVNWWIYNENESCSCIWCWADKMRHAEKIKEMSKVSSPEL